MEDLFIAGGAIFRALVDSAPDAIRVCQRRFVDTPIRLGQVPARSGVGIDPMSSKFDVLSVWANRGSARSAKRLFVSAPVNFPVLPLTPS